MRLRRTLDHFPWPILRAVTKGMRLAYSGSRVGNVAMLHPGRCGSTILGTMLGQHESITWAGEIFEGMTERYRRMSLPDDRRKRAEAILNTSMYVRSKNASYYGFETKTPAGMHLRDEWVGLTVSDYLEFLRSQGFGHFIVLERRNYLRRLISASVSRKTGEWHVKQSPGESVKIRIDPECIQVGNTFVSLVDAFDQMHEHFEDLRLLLSGDKKLDIAYEDDISNDPSIGYRRVCDFLDIEPGSPQLLYQKNNPFRMDQIVDNLDQVSDALSGTRFEWMLHEDDY